MKTLFIVIFAICFCQVTGTIAQVSPCNCSASLGSGNRNFSAITWTGTGCPTAASTSYTGNLCVNLSNGTNLIMDKDFEIFGGLGMTNGGNSTFTLPNGSDLIVHDDMGDDSNNNVTFAIDGNLTVLGGLYGKNSNAFDGGGAGTGSLTVGALVFTGSPSCTNPTNCGGFTWNIGSCAPANSAFCDALGVIINPLPVTLLYFQAAISGPEVELSWATATEMNSSHFAVERSMDGKNFKEIARADAAGNSVVRNEYILSDNHPLVGRAYYRLNQVDLDGTNHYYSMKFVDFNGKRGIAVYPNPAVNADDEITISLNFSSDAKVTAKLMDLSGHEVRRFSFSGTETKLPLKAPKGSYILSLTTGKETYTTRFIIP